MDSAYQSLKGNELVYLRKIMERICILNCVRSAVYFCAVTGVIYTERVATKVCLAYVLINVYGVAVMVVVSVMCDCLLW